MGAQCCKPATLGGGDLALHKDDLLQARLTDGLVAPDTSKEATRTPAAAERAAAVGAAPLDEPEREAEPVAAGMPVAEPFQDRMYSQAIPPHDKEVAVIGKVPRRPSSENVSMEAYTKLHAAKFDKVLALEKPDGWDFKKEEDGVLMFTRSMPGTRLLYFRAASEIPAPPGGMHALVRKFFQSEDRPTWDDMCALGETAQYFPPFYKYSYFQIKPPAPIIAWRDLLTIGRFRFEPDGAFVVAIHSADYPTRPERPDFVRVHFVEGGYVFRPMENGMVSVVWLGCVDPCGWLPRWLVNAAVTKQGATLAKIRKFL